VKKLSLRARAALYYFANSDMTISADRLAEEVLENRKAIQTALRELRDAGLIMTRKERTPRGVATVSYVTEKGFLEANSWGSQNVLQIQQSEQNSIIQVLTNSAINIKRVTIAGRLGDETMGYDFFDKTSNSEALEREDERVKNIAAKRKEYNDAKMRYYEVLSNSKDNREVKDWTVKDSVIEFASHMNDRWDIKPWNMSGSRFFEALGSARKKYDTNGVIEREMINLFFTQLKRNKESDGDKLWKLFISRFSELSNQARLRITSPELMERAKASAEEQWKKEFGEDFSV
jgi:transcription initiation factor IIE alpha subunit